MFDTKSVETKMNSTITRFEDELKKIRTGRANPGMLDGIFVEAYGSRMPLNQVGNITVPEPQLLQVNPFDPSNVKAIVEAIRNDHGLGFNPSDDGRVVRVPIPALTEERRRMIVKQLGEKVEEAKIGLRAVRQAAFKDAKRQKEDKVLSENDVTRVEKEIDKLMGDKNAQIDAIAKDKERDHDNLMSDKPEIPAHVGYIVDGNRRWAKANQLPTYEGHLAGYDALKQTIFATFEQGVQYASIYAFSTENWRRGEGEVGKLMKLALRVFKTDLHEFIDRGIKVYVFGVEDGLKPELIEAARVAEQKTAHGTKGTLIICFNYGGQREIVDAAAACVRDGLTADEITEEAIGKRLYKPDVPPVDVVVRTSGEHRPSNFMLWRIAYSEFIFIKKFWPEMRPDDVTAIIEEYKQRSRRFGG